MARLPFDPPAGRSLLERAYAGFEAAADPTWCLLTASAIIESYMIEWSDMHGIDRWADAIAHYLHDDEARFPSVDVEARVLASCTGVVHRLKHAELMTEISARLFMLLPSIHDAGVRLAVVLPIFWHWIICGNWLHLRQLADEIKPTIPWQEVSPLAAIIWHMLEATLLHNSVEFERARAAFERTETLAATHGVRVYAAATAGYQVCMALNSGDLGAAEAQLAKMRAALDPARRLDVAHCHWAAGALALARGDLAAAAVHARKALVLARDCDSAPPIVHCQLLLAMVQMESGHVDAAAAEIDAALAYSIAARLGAYEQAALMLKAYLLLGADAEAEAGETLRRGLAIAREHEYRIIFPWAPAKVLQTLCGAALRFGVEVEYVRDLVRRLRFAPPDADAPGWPWPVQVYTLGRFAVLRDAAPLAFHGKAQRKPLELLKTLIVLGGEAVAEEELIGKLWPEPPADGGQKALDITVHRLRKLLGSNEALSITDRKISLDPAVVWTDVRVVERLLAHTAKLTEVELEQSGARLLDLYRGEFLTGDEETAVLVAARERLRGRLRRFIERLGAYWERGGRWVEAQELYHRGTELDPVAETLYRASMRCLARLGRPTEAIEAYVRCRRVLSLLLGTKPAAETEALHRELLSGNL
jgi:DNA-binding SARP family transcriptional activator